MASCGTRKKEVETISSSFKFNSVIDTSASLQLNANSLYHFTEASSLATSDLHIEYEGEQGDELSVQQFGADGKLQKETKIKGKGKAMVTNKETTGSQAISESREDNIRSDLSATGTKKINAEANDKKRTVAVKRTGFSFTLWQWIIIFIIIGLTSQYLNKRFQILPWIKKHVLNKKPSEDTFA